MTLTATLFVNAAYGGIALTASDLLQIITAYWHNHDLHGDLALKADIFFHIRLPRIATAALAGAALAAAGVISQGLFRNALASPSIMGSTSGGAALAAIAFYLGAHKISWFLIPAAGFTGALLATVILMALVLRYASWTSDTLLLTGLALNTIFGATTTLALSLILADNLGPPAILHWLMGSVQTHTWPIIASGTLLIGASLFFARHFAGQLDVLILGEKVATSLSIRMSTLRIQAIGTIAMLVGTTVALAGPLPFIGLIVPHITRLLIGAHHRALLAMSVLNGMSLVLFADWLTRTIAYPRDLQVGILIAFLGAPFFLMLLVQRHNQPGGNYG